jgi:hypothetical protein
VFYYCERHLIPAARDFQLFASWPPLLPRLRKAVRAVPAVLSDVVSDVVASVHKLRADGGFVASADQLLNEVEALFDAVTAVQAEIVHRLRDADAVDAPMQACGRGLKGWLREEMLLAGAESSRYLRLVHALRCYPVTEAAFDAAQISLAHVAAIITALETLPQHLRPTLEPHLVERARFFPPEEIAGFIDELLQGLGFDRLAEIRRERRHAGRGVDLHRTLHGSRSLVTAAAPRMTGPPANASTTPSGRSPPPTSPPRERRRSPAPRAA